ncbi:hypothetical protein B7494_g1902 [Chlorociboria aeruginascens]|nr:hypothetical protein B7494_g1902 [Chlorociboria aeruginascens]
MSSLYKPLPSPPSQHTLTSRHAQILRKILLTFVTLILVYSLSTMLLDRALLLGLTTSAHYALPNSIPNPSPQDCKPSPSKVPQYFQTSPELWPGPTATGRPPFLAQSNPVTFAATETFIPNEPLETGQPILGQGRNESIFHLMGFLSPYFVNDGWGVQEFPIPEGAEIMGLHMLSRHGSRYPTTGSNVQAFGSKIANYSEQFKASGQLSFLSDWKYELGAEILVPKGRQELFDSGILHYYKYGKLYNPDTKIIARTSTQDRMLKLSSNCISKFEEMNKKLIDKVIIEQTGFNNSLSGSDACPNSYSSRNQGGNQANKEWYTIYLQNATSRFQSMIQNFDWTIDDTYAAQTMCPYETVAYGYSPFCDLFTYDEWLSFSYSTDLSFAGSVGFQSPVARAIGHGWVQEFIARLENHTLSYSHSQINTTLDDNTVTFPLNQTLYFDFSHDTNIMAILTSLGFTQFSSFLPATHYPGPHNLTVSHITPFATRLDIEVIEAPWPIDEQRNYIKPGDETFYVHFLLNQRTLPLGANFPACGRRLDGWCELDTFLEVQKKEMAKVDWDYACEGDWDPVPYGGVNDGLPLPKSL